MTYGSAILSAIAEEDLKVGNMLSVSYSGKLHRTQAGEVPIGISLGNTKKGMLSKIQTMYSPSLVCKQDIILFFKNLGVDNFVVIEEESSVERIKVILNLEKINLGICEVLRESLPVCSTFYFKHKGPNNNIWEKIKSTMGLDKDLISLDQLISYYELLPSIRFIKED